MGLTARPDAPAPYAPPAATAEPPDAIVFVPALFPSAVQTADDVARRVAAALDRNADSRGAQFFAGERRDESYLAGASAGGATSEPGRKTTRVVSVMRRDGDAPPVRVVDVYDYQYDASLTGAFTSRQPFAQALSVAGVLLANAGRVLRSVKQPSKDGGQKFQAAWGGALFLLLFAYMLYLVATAVASVWGGWQQFVQGETPARWLSVMQGSAAVLVALGLFSRRNMKALVAQVAGQTACAANYVAAGASQKTILGELGRLLEHVAEKGAAPGGVPYRQVHLVAFSFGSVVGIDALFQHGQPARAFAGLDAFVTIGCPFDFVRTYYPTYFDGRHAASGRTRWLNYYAPADVFGSDFLDVAADRSMTPHGVRLAGGGEALPTSEEFGPTRASDARGLGAALSLDGFRVHASYWDADPDALTCFDPIVRALLPGTAALR